MKELSESIRAFIEKEELLRMAYTSGGHPHVVPVWYVILDGDYAVGTYRASAKWKAIMKEPRVGWVIDGGTKDSYKGASFYGRAEEITDAGERANIYRAIGEKYFGAADHPKFVELYGQPDDDAMVYMRLKAEDSLTWEY